MCNEAVKDQSLGLIFHTLAEEKLGSSALMADTVPANVQKSLLRLLDSVLLAHKNVQVAAAETRRDMGVDRKPAEGPSDNFLAPAVCIL